MVTSTRTIEMWEKFKAEYDPDLRQQLILQYAPLVKYVVGRMAISLPDILDSEDVISYATIGLIDAVERFDPRRGLKFETYAIPRIRGSVIDALRRIGVIPRGTRRKMKEIEAAITALEDQHGRTPTDDEVADYMGLSIESYNKELLETSIRIVPLERTWMGADDNESLQLSDIIADTRNPSPDVEAERSELRAALFKAINELTERDRLMLALYYQEELTLKEISQVLGVSESRVCQLHARAILRLRTSLVKMGMTALS